MFLPPVQEVFSPYAAAIFQTTRWTEQLGFWAPEKRLALYHGVYQVSPGTFR